MSKRWNLLTTIILLFQVVSARATDKPQCREALKKMGICLALQSDFYDQVDLKDKYTDQSECIEGVDFYDGIVKEDAKAMTKLYDLRIETKEDPLQRQSSGGLFNNSTSYCAGEISLKVKNEKKSLSVVFTVANSGSSSRVPEITIDL